MFGAHWLLACSSPEPIIPDLAPLEENLATPPAARADEPYPEELGIVSGGDSALWWAHAAGYIHATTAATWLAAQDPEVGLDRREVDEWSVTDDPRPELDASYIVHTVVHDIVTIEYDVWWRHEVQLGTVEEPEQVVVVWSKTEGTSLLDPIDLLQYSMVLSPVEGEDEVVLLEVVGHLDAPQVDDGTLVSYLLDLHASLVAAVNGEPLPEY
jgi:hypothetical protein